MKLNYIGLILILAATLLVGGCDVYTSDTRATFDRNAAYSRLIADACASGKKPDGSAYTIYDASLDLENFARTFQNLSDAGHWKQPTYPSGVTTRPTTIPWNNHP